MLQKNILDKFFHPKSIAVIGASENLISYGSRYIQALIEFGYKGKIYAINHNGEQVLGHKIYRSIRDVPKPVDLVFITIPARFVLDVIKECIAENIKAAVIFTAGFREAGEDGLNIENEIVNEAEGRMRIIGPNCFGTYCPEGGITLLNGNRFSKEPGGVALTAQSGQLSEVIIPRIQGEGLRHSKFISYGNASDINEADLIEYLMNDRDTKIITSYLEGVKDGRRYFDIARKNSGKKPIIIWKVGLSQIGAAASSSHTGSLAGTSAAWDAFFRQTNAVKVANLDELTDTTTSFSCMPYGCGPRVAYVSGGGAGTVIGADACEEAGMEMPQFSPKTEKQLRELFPSIGTSLKNPIDIGNPHPQLDLLKALLEIMSADKNVDVIVVRGILFSVKTSKIFSGTTAPSEKEQRGLLDIPVKVMKKYKKPIAIILPEYVTSAEAVDLEEERRKIRDYFFSHGIPVYLSEQRAFTALAHLAKYRQTTGKAANAVKSENNGNEKIVLKDRKQFAKILEKTENSILDEIQCKTILKSIGIKVSKPILAESGKEAVAVAKKMGYPVVMKVVSPQITHKSDIGGVKLNLMSDRQVRTAYTEIIKAAAKKAAKAKIEGVSIQKMTQPGRELVMGMTKDPQFGPMLMFGLGGIFVEVLKDVSFRILPLSREDAGDMIRGIKAYHLLEGFRGQPAVDVKYLEELLLKLSGFIMGNPEIKEMDINPLIAYKKGAIAVDARIIVEDREESR
jgi:acyl-CoA synthetase (NDP forming)